MERKVVGRFAPSPSGRMHLGNIYAAYCSFRSARGRGGKWLLRHEDLDRQRCRPEHARMIEDDLRWLGLQWDEAPLRQSERADRYMAALIKLVRSGRVYPCSCRRADILAAAAPHQSDGRVVYGGRCRPSEMPGPALSESEAEERLEQWKGRALRLWVPDETVVVEDRIQGSHEFNLARDCGDFIVRRADGGWAYQLAVVVDDAESGVTEVVRGEDLLLSSAQQIYLQDLLGHPHVAYAHIPLLRNESGQRLSKRDGAESMETLRQTTTPENLSLWLEAHLPPGLL